MSISTPQPFCCLVTGGAGFIGSCYVLQSRTHGDTVVTLDKLTYSGNLDNLASLADDPQHIFVRGCIGNEELVTHLLSRYRPDAIINFAAETHVDRSIHDPETFLRTNVMGTGALLRSALRHWETLGGDGRETFRFLHVSTDEVFGTLRPGDPPFCESTPYAPNSPYSASKAASDHLVRAFHETYGLPTLITNCSNNYGPRQFPEKLIPLVIGNALEGKALPVYGSGENIRDWLHVEDHCEAIRLVLHQGRPGSTYTIGGRAERSNIQVVREICSILDELRSRKEGPHADLIRFVTDRPGHDFRYAIDCGHIERKLGWTPRHTFEDGLRRTARWYLDNAGWLERVRGGTYRDWMAQNYGGNRA